MKDLLLVLSDSLKIPIERWRIRHTIRCPRCYKRYRQIRPYRPSQDTLCKDCRYTLKQMYYYTIVVACPTLQRAHQLMMDYKSQYPKEVVTIDRYRHLIIQSDGMMIRFESILQADKIKSYNADVFTEEGFREMYQIR